MDSNQLNYFDEKQIILQTNSSNDVSPATHLIYPEIELCIVLCNRVHPRYKMCNNVSRTTCDNPFVIGQKRDDLVRVHFSYSK